MNYTYEFMTLPDLETGIATSANIYTGDEIVIEKETGYYLKLQKKHDSTNVIDWEKWKAEERIQYWIRMNHPELLI